MGIFNLIMTNLKKAGEYTHPNLGGLSTLRNERNEAFFVAKEICEILEYRNHSKAIEDHVWAEYKFKLDNETLLSLGFNLGQRGGVIISEAGMYQLALTSKSKNAKPFQKWVYEEVLPSIRKHGMYATEVTIENMINDPDFAIGLLTKLKEEKQLRIEAEKQNQVLENKVENLSVAFNIESQWLSILKVAMNNKVSEKIFDWRKLKKESQRLGFEVKKMASRRFEYQNLYHKDVFRCCYPQLNYNFED